MPPTAADARPLPSDASAQLLVNGSMIWKSDVISSADAVFFSSREVTNSPRPPITRAPVTTPAVTFNPFDQPDLAFGMSSVGGWLTGLDSSVLTGLLEKRAAYTSGGTRNGHIARTDFLVPPGGIPRSGCAG